MRGDEMVLEALAPAAHGREGQPPREPAVPPVRTIVLDREPVPARPPSEREALRPAHGSGPERLLLRDLSVAYGGTPAVKSVSLSIHQGEVLALIGPSGWGE